ncbi:hypothetical protein E8E13_001426 [Curvularia kusanoi]|uniref:Heterokaryon incompatibility domain-containing protein n=1 Tax=Curvularia kusanoi TaxID=90978 RepID=A0A9P4T5T1_CURKU|nr:hypothetical protein E8E13_001426 [Curvularia kusanoi]
MDSQLDQMHTIYNQASATIVAAAGQDSSYGLPGVGQRHRTLSNRIALNGTTWRYWLPLVGSQLGSSKWLKRGWTYQEAVFSRRCVIFADDQVYFQCGCMSRAEELIEDLKPYHAFGSYRIFPRISDTTREDERVYWPKSGDFMEDLERYSKRDLTYDSDVLRALDGVFTFYAQLKPSVEHFWGLPLRWIGCKLYTDGRGEDAIYRVARSRHGDMIGALLWAMLWEPVWSEVQFQESGFAKRGGFPTWSWSGWKVGVSWNYLRDDLPLKQAFTTPLSVEITGGVVILDEKFAQSLNSGQSYAALGLSPILRIEARVFDVPFIECEPFRPSLEHTNEDPYPARCKGQHWVRKEEGPNEGNWTYFSVQ